MGRSWVYTRVVVVTTWLVFGLGAAGLAAQDLPNIVIIFTDDQGYADVGVFGADGFETPRLDRMASEGIRFTSFYVAQPVCSASRAALLTGSYPNRIGIHGALGPASTHGISEDELTLAGLLKQKNYATAVFGKWHLGHHPQFLPTRHGFDEYFGLPYSNDMWPHHPTAGDRFPPLPLLDGEKVIELDPDQTQLTTRYTERAVQFIERNAGRPFFLYLAHSMPHVPLFVSDKHQGKSEVGLYGDVIMEIDWSVGRILDTLQLLGLDEKTLVMFTSDNGPWLSYGNHSGSAHPLREGKGTVWEGGVRVPFIARWPRRIPAGSVNSEPVMTIDILPTVARLIEGRLPPHPIDGKDISALLFNQPGARSPHEALFFYYGVNELQAVRSGRWKMYLPHRYRTLEGRPEGRDGKPAPYSQRETAFELYDLENDISERTNVVNSHLDVVRRLMGLVEQARRELGDALMGRQGEDARPAGRLH